jgi:anti-sigma factor RsiW
MKPDTEIIQATWTPAEDLEWTAFRYVANELSAAEAVAFEDRLADDQAAREAVARCVQLTHSVVALEEARSPQPAGVPAGPGRNDRRQRRWAVAAALIAAAAVCFAFWIGREYSQRDRDDSGDQIVRAKPDGIAPPANGRPSVKRDAGGAADPSVIIAGWLNFDAAEALGSDASLVWEEPAKPSSGAAAPADGSFNWVVAAVDDAPLSVPVPPKTSKEPN